MDRAQEVGVFRWRVVGEAVDPSLSPRERGMLVRALAAREYLGPDGRWVRVSRNTLDRWIRAYREGGFDALVPAPRRMPNQTPARLLELACALRREQPARTAAQIHRIIVEAEGGSPSARTIQRHFVAAGLPWKGGQIGRALGRFEAEQRNELWTGDALHGPIVDGHRTFLFCFLDDHSRLFCGYRWAAREDVLNASAALRAGLASRGLPKALYVDNGSPFVSGQLLRACAVLGIRLIHSTPGRPEGRGKIERAFRTVRQQWLVEPIISAGVAAAVKPAVRETVEAVERLTRSDCVEEGVDQRQIVAELGIDKGAVSRRVADAIACGYLRNLGLPASMWTL
ncbi:MAG TPA: DDE-type integrase/transposase/recombinase [Solirubrobacteraceae bacterium]|nr:DDE-type integrase/transposase/recombinase [Solirubrobacteraceae bacterium]